MEDGTSPGSGHEAAGMAWEQFSKTLPYCASAGEGQAAASGCAGQGEARAPAGPHSITLPSLKAGTRQFGQLSLLINHSQDPTLTFQVSAE